jgi:hypothetical protein
VWPTYPAPRSTARAVLQNALAGTRKCRVSPATREFPITLQPFRVLGQTKPKAPIHTDPRRGQASAAPDHRDFFKHRCANIHRGRHYLSEMATDLFEHVSDDGLPVHPWNRSGNTAIPCGSVDCPVGLGLNGRIGEWGVIARRKDTVSWVAAMTGWD